MKRIDELAGATVKRIEVGRNGTLHLYFEGRNGGSVWAWSPMIVQIPREPKKRKAKR